MHNLIPNTLYFPSLAERPKALTTFEGTVRKISFQTAQLEYLDTLVAPMTAINWSSPNLYADVLDSMACASAKARHQSPALDKMLSDAHDDYQQRGFCVFSLSPQACCQENILRTKLVFLLSQFGKPFGAFQKKGFWQTLGVNPDAKELRAESSGYIPLHIDFNQAQNPPDGVALFCVRPDPSGGGENTVFNYADYLDALPPCEIQKLAGIEYSYSTLYEQNEIGAVYNPHPLLETNNGEPGLFRYNAKAMLDVDKDLADVFANMEACFKKSSAIVSLDAGDLLVINQRKVLHGRLPLGQRQVGENIPADCDRFLWQTYLRHPST